MFHSVLHRIFVPDSVEVFGLCTDKKKYSTSNVLDILVKFLFLLKDSEYLIFKTSLNLQ